MATDEKKIKTRCCIAGGGPAGIMLGYLLARAGIDVVVLEKYKDFFRDFRGDTVHPSTLEVLYDLGLLDRFLALPHDEVRELSGEIGGKSVAIADFTHLPTHCKFIALVPQWDFLNFLSEEAKKIPSFHLMLETEATGLILERGRVLGVEAKGPDGPIAIRAELTIGADGRHSTIRDKSGLDVESFGAPMDVLWFRISRIAGDVSQPLGKLERGRIIIMIARGTYWQCAYLIRKGAFEDIKKRGLDNFRSDVETIAPELRDRLGEIKSFDDVKLLTVTVDRLTRWQRRGLLCIGDAAHAMSPIGGVGINLAIQDAVAAANILVPAFCTGSPRYGHLRAVQKRREFPTRATQWAQVLIQNRIIARIIGKDIHLTVPLPLRLLGIFPFLRRIPARLVGIGVRPEHPRIFTADNQPATSP
jgi:2-polyprenyl-6-methoxyphenol hydroxylase-like FAD-dependent oxidoreductase